MFKSFNLKPDLKYCPITVPLYVEASVLLKVMAHLTLQAGCLIIKDNPSNLLLLFISLHKLFCLHQLF